jgi:Rad3-related DNA helicase
MKNIMDFFPGTPRQVQTNILQTVEANWNKYDVFCITAPTASGKTRIAKTIMDWADSGAYIVPTNVLVDQVRSECTDLQTIARRDTFKCEERQTECPVLRRSRCRGCCYNAAVARIRAADKIVVNFHMYLSLKLYNKVLVVDEAHTLLPMLAEANQVKIWRHRYRYPSGRMHVADVLAWMESYLETREDEFLAEAYQTVRRMKDYALVEVVQENYRGRREEVLRVVPNTAHGMPPVMWPKAVRKIVLMSATINEKEIEELGLHTKRVCYIDSDSPIPAANRMFYVNSVGNMGMKYEDVTIPLAVQEINRLLTQHPDKGLIHAPYRLVEKLRAHLTDPRFMWHERHDKREMLQQFRDSPPESGRVLIASGMYEGVDLPHDAARWQVIVKVPYLSLGDEAVKKKADKDAKWYAWEAIKQVVQAAGRISRTPDDFGETYILDSNFTRLYRSNTELFPPFFRPSVKFLKQ